MSNAKASIDLNISEGMIANAIAVAIAEAFSPDKKDQVIRDIVRAHLATKTNSYDRETILSAAIGKQVRQIASEAVKAKVASMEPEITAVVDEMLGPQFRGSILEQLKSALSRLAVSNIQLNANAVFD